MTKKNAIVILVDSIFSDCLSNRRTEESSTPFIDSIMDDCLFADKVYSYGPHTDAASKGLYCGNRSLDDYGYYFGMNSSEYNIHRVFKENGYETFAYYYPYYFIGTKTNKYIDNIVYTSGMIWRAIWFGKYQYYAELMEKRKLSDVERRIIEEFTDFLFDTWKAFYKTLDEQPSSGVIIGRLKEAGSSGGKELLEQEFEKYQSDKKTYILDLLKKGMDHPFAKINDYNPDRYVDTNYLKKIYSENNKFFRQLFSINLFSNIKNNKIPLINGIKEFCSGGSTNSSLTRWLLCAFAPLSVKKRSLKSQWQFEPSFFNQITTMFEQIDERKMKDRPFFFSIHTEDAHQNISFLSYDMKDESIIREEIEYLKPLVYRCGKKYKGNLTYQLSLRYIDLCVKRIFNALEERNLLSDTSIILMADHGSSFTGFPIRNIVVNNFHVENYRTPFLMWNYETRSFNGFYSNKYSADMVLPSICKNFEFDIPKEICQQTIMDMPEGKPYIITEYMGRGCPDMITREIWISLRNNKYCIAYKSRIDKTFDVEHPSCIFDLVNDIWERNNLASTDIKNESDIRELMLILKNRFEEIQRDTRRLLANIESFKVIE